jgi:hypothetical protein
VRKLERENDELKELTTSIPFTTKSEDEAFWEGAAWMAKKVNRMADNMAEEVPYIWIF